MRWVALVLLAFGLFYAGLSGFNGGERDAARRELRTVRDSLRTARYERDDARDSLREARWAMAQIDTIRGHATAVVGMTEIRYWFQRPAAGRWITSEIDAREFDRIRAFNASFAIPPLRAFPDSTDR